VGVEMRIYLIANGSLGFGVDLDLVYKL